MANYEFNDLGSLYNKSNHITWWRLLILVAIANQAANLLPRTYYADQATWDKTLMELKLMFPKEGVHARHMIEARHELSLFINKSPNVGHTCCGNEQVAMADPVLLDLVADAFGDLDGVFGFILAANPFISDDLASSLYDSSFSHMGQTTKGLIEQLLRERNGMES